ncbi:hypothetical protein MMH89_02545 [Candidatus Comchoanobacter bicostacola]|uniref:Uncharacterized protein n=1 Tax=Candidatus Comchoanobacter bicostacola TaxID=2919598 RepID=A0ABY5DH56_9GAMM|nr:hypothetical protein [Candidatus Comchoanobacter bicostacola]UTC24105.1 hypothetical protein MMH89_02545 [Candidatus Comchoanobacter bicostacola]
MNRYKVTQYLCLISCISAATWWWFFPGNDLNSEAVVSGILSLLQTAIVPNAFFSLLTAIITLSKDNLRLAVGGFLKAVGILWGVVIATLFLLWLLISNSGVTSTTLPTFNHQNMGVTILIPLVMLCSIILGFIIVKNQRLHRFIEPIQSIQNQVAILFDYIFYLIPVLVFFVIIKFLMVADFNHSIMAINYFLLAVSFVLLINIVMLPLLFRYVLWVPLSEYGTLVAPAVFMTFLAGDSIAAIPMIAHAAANKSDPEDLKLSKIITLVVICFPWVGELANLAFPIYSATIEGYGVSTIASILSVGPFFMFTDPYLSIPALLSAFNFPEIYKVTYLTLALLTDHMFEVSEAIAVLFVVVKIKQSSATFSSKRSPAR